MLPLETIPNLLPEGGYIRFTKLSGEPKPGCQNQTQKFLAGMAQGVHTDLARALQSGVCSLPADLLGAHAGQTLQNLRAYIEYGSLEAARQAGGLAMQAGESS